MSDNPFRRLVRHISWPVLQSLFPLVAAHALYRRWTRFPPTQTPSRERDWMAAASRSTLGAVPVWRWGEGPPVLLVPGWGGRASQLGALADSLARAGFSAIALDPFAAGHKAMTAQSLIQLILRAQQTWGPFRVVLAHSFAGLCVVQASRQGLQADRWVILASPTDYLVLVDAWLRRQAPSPRVERRFRRLLEAANGASVWHDLSFLAPSGPFPQPALLIYDQDDPCSDMLNHVVAVWRGAELIMTEGLGHYRLLHEESVIQHVLTWLSSPSV